MKAAAWIGLALMAGACTMESEENQLENAIRDNLANQASVEGVEQVEMAKQEDGNFTGHAMIRERGRPRANRVNCNAQRTGDTFNFRCSPAIDEAVLTEMEGIIRRTLSEQAQVVDVQMQRQNDDNHMTGHAIVADGGGNQARLACTAERDSANVGQFQWQCAPPGAEAETDAAE